MAAKLRVESLCCTKIKYLALRLILYFTYSTRSNALTHTKIDNLIHKLSNKKLTNQMNKFLKTRIRNRLKNQKKVEITRDSNVKLIPIWLN